LKFIYTILLSSILATSLSAGFMLLDNNSDQNPQSQILCWNSDSAIIQLKFPGFYSNLFEHEGKNYSKISLRKHSCKADSFGKPLLPEIIYNYIIPRDCRFRISVREHSDTTLYNYTIYPWQNTLDNNHRFYLDRNAYDGDIYCQNPIENIDYSHWRELEFLSLRFNPIGYFTSGDSIIVTKSLTLKIDFIDKGKEYSDLSPMTMKLGDHIFANSKHFINTYRSYSPDNSPAIAIICPNIFEISAKRLARWRQNEGYRVKLSKTSDIPGGTSSYIDSTILYEYIHNLHGEENLEYVLLIGARSSIPWYDMTWQGSWYGGISRTAISDIAYAYSSDCAFPEFMVGRIPFSETESLDRYIDNLIFFESNYLESDSNSFYSNLIVAAGMGGTSGIDPIARFAFEAESLFLPVIADNFTESDINYLVESVISSSILRDEDPTKSNIFDRLTCDSHFPGAFFLSIHSHGSSGAWFMRGSSGSMGYDDIISPYEDFGDTLFLDHRTPFVRAIACQTARWDPAYNNVGSAWINQAAIGYFGQTAIQFWGNTPEFLNMETSLLIDPSINNWGELYLAALAHSYPLYSSSDQLDSSYALSKEYLGDPGARLFVRTHSLDDNPHQISLELPSEREEYGSTIDVFYLKIDGLNRACTLFVDSVFDKEFYDSCNAKVCISTEFIDSNTVHCEKIKTSGIDNIVVFNHDDISVNPDTLIEIIPLEIVFSGDGFITQKKTLYIGGTDTTCSLESDIISISIDPGWNLISFHSLTDKTFREIFTNPAYTEPPKFMELDEYGEGEYFDISDSIPEVGKAYWVESSIAEVGSLNTLSNYNGYFKGIDKGANFLGAVDTPNDSCLWATSHRVQPLSIAKLQKWSLLGWDNQHENYYFADYLRDNEGYIAFSVYPGEISVGESPVPIIDDVRYLPRLIRHIPSIPGLPDTGHLDVNIDWECDSISVDRENVLMLMICGDNVYQKNLGESKNAIIPELTPSDSTWIVFIKPGFRRYIVHPHGNLDNFALFPNCDTLWGDVYLPGDILIGQNDTLVIMPGTNIYTANKSDSYGSLTQSDRTEIWNKGYIEANGTPEKPILFTCDKTRTNKQPGDWRGIIHTMNGRGYYNNCRFEYMRYFLGYNGCGEVEFIDCEFAHTLYYTITYGSSNHGKETNLRIERCKFDTLGSLPAIVTYKTSDLSYIKDCIFDSTASYVFEIKDSSKMTIENCSFQDCYGGFKILDFSSVEICNCDMYIAISKLGLTVCYGGSLYANNCTFIKENGGYGPYAFDRSFMQFRDCSVTGFDWGGISYYFSNGDLGIMGDLGHNCIWCDNYSTRIRVYPDCIDTILSYGNWLDDPTKTEGPLVQIASIPVGECDLSVVKSKPDEYSDHIPDEYEFKKALPNPFNSSVNISFDLPEKTDVEISIFDLLGNKVITLVQHKFEPGEYSLVWDGRNDEKASMPSGTYFCRMRTSHFNGTRKLVLIK